MIDRLLDKAIAGERLDSNDGLRLLESHELAAIGAAVSVNVVDATGTFGLGLVAAGCAVEPLEDPGIGTGFSDDFERAQLGKAYKQTGGNWRIEGGKLHVQGAKNHPLWLLRTLPRDVRVEFDARSETADGDIKVEIFGDGASYAKNDSYTATSYVVIFGGWNNSMNVLARMDEHGADRVVVGRILTDREGLPGADDRRGVIHIGDVDGDVLRGGGVRAV